MSRTGPVRRTGAHRHVNRERESAIDAVIRPNFFLSWCLGCQVRHA